MKPSKYVTVSDLNRYRRNQHDIDQQDNADLIQVTIHAMLQHLQWPARLAGRARFVWLIWFVLFNQKNQTDQIDQTDQINKTG